MDRSTIENPTQSIVEEKPRMELEYEWPKTIVKIVS